MNSILKFSISYLSLLTLFIGLAFGQDSNINNIPEGRFLVIGSFHLKRNAIGFSEYVKKMDKYEVKLAYHPVTRFYHVYIKGYLENKDGYADVKIMRRQTEFIDVWFYIVEPYNVEDKNSPQITQIRQEPGIDENEGIDEEKDTKDSGGWIRAKSPDAAGEESTSGSLAVAETGGDKKASRDDKKSRRKNKKRKAKKNIGIAAHVINASGELIGTIDDEGIVRDAEGKVIGYVTTTSEDGTILGALGPVGTYGQVVGIDGGVTGTVGADGQVRDATGKVIGSTDWEGQVIDADGNNIGVVGAFGQVVATDGQLIGTVDLGGQVIGPDGKVIGPVDADGNVRDVNGNIIGSIEADGLVIDAYGQMIGIVGAYGKVMGVDGKEIGSVGPDGKVRDAYDNIIGTVDASGKVIDANGNIIGTVGAYGEVIGINGEVIGTVGNDGRVRDINGNVLGIVNADGKVRGADGQVIGAIGGYGQVIGTDGKMIGAVGADGKVRDANGGIIGTVGAYGKVRDVDSIVIGAVGAYGQVIGADGEIIGTVGDDGKVRDANGNVIGTIGEDGKVRDANGNVIGSVGGYGHVIGLNGTVIGLVGADLQVIGIGADRKVIGTLGDNGEVRDAEGILIGHVGLYGQVIGLEGTVIGTVSNGKVMNANGNVVGTVGAYGRVIDANGSVIGSVGAYGQVIGTDAVVIGVVGAFGQIIDSDSKTIGTIGAGILLIGGDVSRATGLGADIPTRIGIPQSYVEKGKYKLYFNTYYVKTFKEIKGGVDIINPKTLKLLRVAQSLELVKIQDPNNDEHSIQLIANIFGYKKVQHDVKLDDPFSSGAVIEEFFRFKGDTLIADFPLRRYDRGDIATMYNVFFFKDAAVMKPNSEFEINSLIGMFKENDELRIKIHGHTNGTKRGKIITIRKDSKNYFTLNQEIIEDFGSAKELSLQRAEVIKNYLISYGLDASRMEVIGWGGKKPVYDEMDKLAIKNVRVEIEILEN